MRSVSGSSGSYSYSVAADWADRPVNYVSWGDAARFTNWLHNGQPSGAQGDGTTEDGAYDLNGATSDSELMAITRESDAAWLIPTENQWYKAAYHKNDGVTANYWDYATQADDPNVPNNGNPGGDTGNTIPSSPLTPTPVSNDSAPFPLVRSPRKPSIVA